MPAGRATLLVFLGVFAAGLLLFSRHNDFPFYYHPDEPGKVGQVIKNKRNLHHPLLMLTTVDLTRRVTLWGEAKKDPQNVVEVGRWVTAAFAALAAAALAGLASRVHGLVAGIAVGALCVANPLLYELAHYFKEDPYLVAGLAVTCLALHRLSVAPDARGIALLGAATALAAAGKYVGFILLPVSIAATLLANSSPLPRSRRIGWLLGSFAFVWFALNWWVFKSPEMLWRSLGEEANKAFGGEEGPTRSVPHAYYVAIQQIYSSGVLWIGCALWAILASIRRIRVTFAEWVLLATALLLFAIFSFTPKTSPRYHLPTSVAISYFAVIGAVGTARLMARNHPQWAPALGAVFAMGLLIPEAQKLHVRMGGFAHDDRVDLESFVRTKLLPNTVIAQDEASNLPEPDRRWEHSGRSALPQKIIGKKQIADRADLAGLRAEGVTHVAICARTYQRFLAGGDTPERRFYETALKRGTIVFSREPGIITYLQPGLSLIDITQLK
jgi:hypothetical protein